MSQAKVDKYKEDKKNRKKIIAREKRNWFLTKLSLTCVGLAMVVWIGYSTYSAVSPNNETEQTGETSSYTLDSTALSDYINSLQND